MQIKLYLDEDAQAESLLKALRRHNVDVLTTNEADMVGSSDIEQLVFATGEKKTIYTFNIRDFLPLHYRFLQDNKEHSGIILGEQTRFDVGGQLKRLLKIIDEKSGEEMQNELEFLSNW